MRAWITGVAAMLTEVQRLSILSQTYAPSVFTDVGVSIAEQVVELNQVIGPVCGGVTSSASASQHVVRTGDGSATVSFDLSGSNVTVNVKLGTRDIRTQSFPIRPIPHDVESPSDDQPMGLMFDGTVVPPESFVSSVLFSAVKLLASQWPNEYVKAWSAS